MKKILWSNANKLWRWSTREGSEFANNLSRDLRSLRALWNWIFMALFCWINVWGVLYHPEICLNTSIVTTGGLVSAIFGAYVFSKLSEKKNGLDKIVVPEERGESD